MLKIKKSYFTETGTWYDHELEDGTYLHESEWNGEEYTIKEGKEERRFRPIFEHDEELDQYETIGFEEL
jgi:hypothetical protein